MDLTVPARRNSVGLILVDNPAIEFSATGISARPSVSSRIRVSRWRGDRFTAQLSPSRSSRQTEALDVFKCLETLRSRGVRQAITPALSSWDAQPFLEAGFTIHEHLHLLSRPLVMSYPEPKHKSRAGAPWHRQGALEVDSLSFEPFWRFDIGALNEAKRATPTHRFRVITRGGSVVAYAIHGRAGARGYLQRLAVRPEFEGQGLGTSLIHDGFAWLSSKGSTEVLVNTQEHNSRALALYEHVGYALQNEKLSVLTWSA